MKRKSEQQKRFEGAAREAGCDETGQEFERAFSKVVPPKLPKRPKPKSEKPGH